jgi:DNA modification methylase
VKVQTCVTSPPYFGLRDYGHEGQIGLEQTPEEYIAAMVEVFRCVKDVLADDGTLWVNIGDSYARQGGKHSDQPRNWDGRKKDAGAMHATRHVDNLGDTYKAKDLIGIPWMLAFALRADGWYLRQDIIWHKPNPMPESVRDRCTKAHEYIFLLSKSDRYFFDSEAMKEPAVGNASGAAASFKRNGSKREQSIPGQGYGTHRPEREDVAYNETRNRRSVWTVATKPYKGAHFATFPTALIEPCVLAGSRPNDIVLDPFMGSGTTAQVAIQHGRQYLGCELNQEYGDLQQERITKATPQKTDEAQMSLLDPLSAEA